MSNVRPDMGVNSSAALEFLQSEVGARILNIILNAKKGQVSKWIGDSSLMSNESKKLVSAMYDVVSILRSYVSQRETRLWLVDHSDFLFGVPAKEIRTRPEDVRMAALNRVSRGEYYDLWREDGTQTEDTKTEDTTTESNRTSESPQATS